MSGGKEQENTNKMIDSNVNANNQFASQFGAGQGANASKSSTRNDQTYNDLYSGYSNLASGGAGGFGGAFARMDPNSGLYGDVNNAYHEFMGPNGGLDPNRVAGMDKSIEGMDTMGKLGASDAASAARLRGGGVYDEFAKTGGISDDQANGIMDQSARQGRSMYTGATQDMQRLARAQGGSANPAAIARMSREGAQAANQSNLDAQTRIAGMRTAGRQWGAGGMTDSEGRIIANQNAGMGAAFGAKGNLADTIRQGRQFGISGVHSLADTQLQSQQQGASASNAAAGNAFGARLAGLGGLMDLRNQETGQEDNAYGNQLGANGQRSSGNTGLIDARIQNNPRKTFGDYLSQGLGAAGGIMTGFGSMGIKPSRAGAGG